MKFRYTILYVNDVRSTIDFFQRAFGLEAGFVDAGGDFGELLTGDTKLAFCSHTLLTQLGKAPATPDAERPVFEIAMETENVAAALDRALQAGATLKQPVRTESWGQTTAYVSDPNGFLIEICSPVGM